jgi:hypothetical protein
VTVLPSTRVLLEHAVDYAGTFPPAGLPLGEAVGNYAHERGGAQAWLLGRLVVSAGNLDELASALPGESAHQHELSVILSGDALPQLARVRAFNQHCTGRARVVSVEFPPAPAADMAHLASRVDRPLEAFFESPIDDDLETRLDAMANAGVHAKVRTGGIVPAAIPTPSSLARFLQACAARRLAFKATAGLHHAVRSCYSLTDERESATAVMHGFLNVSVAAALAHKGASIDEIAEALSEISGASFDFHQDGLVYNNVVSSLEDLALTRRHFFRSFGSCSFREPVEELTRLHLV